MNTEEHDELWDLLGKAREPKASPFFSRNVLRAIREEQQETAGVLAWLKRRWQFAAIGAGALAAVTFVALPQLQEETPQPADALLLAAHEVSISPDYQVISHLDELLDSEQNSVWLENTF